MKANPRSNTGNTCTAVCLPHTSHKTFAPQYPAPQPAWGTRTSRGLAIRKQVCLQREGLGIRWGDLIWHFNRIWPQHVKSLEYMWLVHQGTSGSREADVPMAAHNTMESWGASNSLLHTHKHLQFMDLWFFFWLRLARIFIQSLLFCTQHKIFSQRAGASPCPGGLSL